MHSDQMSAIYREKLDDAIDWLDWVEAGTRESGNLS